MAHTKRIRIVNPDEIAQQEQSEGFLGDRDESDYEEYFTEAGDPVKRGTTVPEVIAICDQLEIGVNSLVHFGIAFRFRRDRNKRLDAILKQIEEIRVALQFDEFMTLKKERGEV